MGTLGDDISPTEHVLAGLGQGPTSEQLPLRMLCPADHEVVRDLWKMDTPGLKLVIPYYVCIKCTILYRYQECRLIPGDEGRPE